MEIDASLAVNLGAAIDRNANALTNVERAMLRPPAQPFAFRKPTSGVVDAGGDDLVLSLGGPQQGNVWYIRGVTVGGLSYATAASGSALLVITATSPTNAAQVGLTEVYDNASALPLTSTYGRGEIPLQARERAYLIIVGGTAAQMYVAAATIEQYETGERSQTVPQ